MTSMVYFVHAQNKLTWEANFRKKRLVFKEYFLNWPNWQKSFFFSVIVLNLNLIQFCFVFKRRKTSLFFSPHWENVCLVLTNLIQFCFDLCLKKKEKKIISHHQWNCFCLLVFNINLIQFNFDRCRKTTRKEKNKCIFLITEIFYNYF